MDKPKTICPFNFSKVGGIKRLLALYWDIFCVAAANWIHTKKNTVCPPTPLEGGTSMRKSTRMKRVNKFINLYVDQAEPLVRAAH